MHASHAMLKSHTVVHLQYADSCFPSRLNDAEAASNSLVYTTPTRFTSTLPLLLYTTFHRIALFLVISQSLQNIPLLCIHTLLFLSASTEADHFDYNSATKLEIIIIVIVLPSIAICRVPALQSFLDNQPCSATELLLLLLSLNSFGLVRC